MWSWPGKPMLHNIARHRRSTLIWSKPSQPVYASQPVERYPACARRCQNIGKHLRKGLALEIDIGSGVVHRRVKGSVTEPLADRREAHAGLQKMNRGRVSERVGMDTLGTISVDRTIAGGKKLLQ